MDRDDAAAAAAAAPDTDDEAERALLAAPAPARSGDEEEEEEGVDDSGEDAAGGDEAPAKRPRPAVGKRANPEKAKAAAESARQLAAVRAEQARLQKSRVRFLLGKSEIFEHFLSLADGAAAPGAGAAPARGGPPQAHVAAAAAAAAGKGASASAAAAAGGGSPTKRGAGGGKRARDDDAAAGGAGEEDSGLPVPTTRLSAQPASIPPPHTLRDYQLEGLNWMIGLHETGLNGILADEMGLGKTFQTIALLAWLAEQGAAAGGAGPHLVLVPKSTLSNWANELARFCPALRVITLAGEKEARQVVLRTHLQPGVPQVQRGWHVLLTTYEVAVIEKGPLTRLHWQYLVIDEAHR
jgi:SWI/SNF-related matrix-associated actin-dependent regulator of chromatin subfamily A member 5